MQKCDALAIDFAFASEKQPERLKLLKTADNGSVFVLVSPGDKNIDSYAKWLETLAVWQKNILKYPGSAGVWIQDWKKLNRIWRQAE